MKLNRKELLKAGYVENKDFNLFRKDTDKYIVCIFLGYNFSDIEIIMKNTNILSVHLSIDEIATLEEIEQTADNIYKAILNI